MNQELIGEILTWIACALYGGVAIALWIFLFTEESWEEIDAKKKASQSAKPTQKDPI